MTKLKTTASAAKEEAGNFLYIGAADLIPEVNKEAARKINSIHLFAFIFGLLLLWLASVITI